MAANAGAEFVLFDMEHGGVGIDTLKAQFAFARGTGFAAEAGIDRRALEAHNVQREAAAVATNFIGDASAQLQTVIHRQAARHSGWFARLGYECLFTIMLVALLYRFEHGLDLNIGLKAFLKAA